MATRSEQIFRGPIAALHDTLSKGAATLERQHTVEDADLGMELTALELSGLHADAETSLTLVAADAGPVRGTIPDGLVLTIDGGTYTVDGDADAASNAFAVTITTGLDGAKADGTAVSLASAVSYGGSGTAWAHATGGPLRADEVPPDLVGTVTRRVKLRAENAPATPRKGDYVTLGGIRGRVARVDTRSSGWTLWQEAA